MGRVLCRIGRHRWLRRRDAHAERTGGLHQVCARCGRERIRPAQSRPAAGVARYTPGQL